MKRLQYLPIILLIGSLGVLAAMFVVRGVNSRKQAAAYYQTQTAIAGLPTATQIPSATPQPTETSTPEPTATEEPTATQEPTATENAVSEVEEGCNEAAYIADVTIPDGTELDPDQKFVKTWRLQNTGTCTWSSRYKLVFYSGEQMDGPKKSQAFTINVPPGTTIDISVTLRAPKEEGKYKGNWKLEDGGGNQFGLGPAGGPFYVLITVTE
jgi:hypothetical protein